MRVVLTTAAFLLAAGMLATGLFLSGFLSPAANEQHAGAVYRSIDFIVDAGIGLSASGIAVPELDDARRIERGVAMFQETCVQCHGAPGIAADTFALGMTPVPPSLMQAARERPASEIFWIVRNGIRTTGMPSWGLKFSDEEIWDIVAAVKALRRLSPVEYYDLAGVPGPDASAPGPDEDVPTEPGDRDAGRHALRQFGCISCHQVEDVVGPRIWVGPPLRDFADQRFIAGVLPNTRDNMVRWIMNPQGVDPLTAMPDVGIDEQSAKDIAAYLASL